MAMAPKKPVAKAPAKTPVKNTTPMPKKTTKAPAMPKGQKPAVGADKAAKKKYGSSSWNNGYTN
jgi:hypothetical protein